MVPMFIGCPPGKRLAFDITYTLQYNRQQNKHYFDCVHVDREMPCFLFRDSACPAVRAPLPPPLGPPCPLTSPLLFLLVLASLLPPLSVLHLSGPANFFSSWLQPSPTPQSSTPSS